MTRGKLVRRRNGQFLPVVETVEERIFPGQTWGVLSNFIDQTGVATDSVLNTTIGAGYAVLAADPVSDTSQLSIAPAGDGPLLPQVAPPSPQATSGIDPAASWPANLDGTSSPSIAFGGSALPSSAGAGTTGFGSMSIAGDATQGQAGAPVQSYAFAPPAGYADSSMVSAFLSEPRASASGSAGPLTNVGGSATSAGGSLGQTPPILPKKPGSSGGTGGIHGRNGTADPLWVLDANNAIVVTPGVTEHEFSTWSVDLRAQVSAGTVATYNWDTSQAPDVRNVTGANTYRLQFNWATFTGVAHPDYIKITTTNTDNTQQVQTLTFSVTGIDSPAWTGQPPTSISTWGNVLAPDQLRDSPLAPAGERGGGEGIVAGHNYQLRLADGAVLTDHMLPSYNPGVPPLDLIYSSTAADTKPIFVDHYQLDPTQAVPTRVSAQLTFNGVTGPTVWYDTSLLNPGDIMQIALQGDATGLATGRYNYSIAVTAQYGTPVTTTDSGTINVINPSNSFFGPGWSLDNYYRIWSETGGAILETPGGLSLWFANGQQSGTFVSPAGDFSTLVQNQDGTFTRTMTDGSKYNFNTSGRQTSFVETNGDTFTCGYNGSNQLTTITDFDNLVTNLAYTSGVVSSITDPANRVTLIGHNGQNQLTTITDPDSALWQYGYVPSSNRLASVTDPRTKVASFTYGFTGRISSVTRQDNTTEQLTPVQMQGFAAQGTGTSSGNPATSVLTVQGFANYTDPRNNVWQTYLDWLGFGLTQQDSDPLGDMAITRHDGNGLEWLMADEVGNRTRDFFDAQGNVTKEVNADDTYSLYVYNGFSEVMQYTNPRGYISFLTYDTSGNLTQFKDALNGLTNYTYTAHGFVATRTDALNHQTSYTYDTRDRLTRETFADNSHVDFTYNAASDVLTRANELGFVWSYVYDPMDRLTQETLPDSNPQNHPQWNYQYNVSGDLTTVTDPLSHSVTSVYDNMDRETSRTDALSHTTSWGYDAAGNNISTTDALNRTWNFTFDAADRQTGTTDPLNHVWTTTYDAAGEDIADTDPLNQTVTYTYTPRGWLATETSPTQVSTDYSYDANGNKTQVTFSGPGLNKPPITHFTYDALDRRTSYSDPNNHTWSLSYNAVGDIVSTTDPLNHSYTLGYGVRDWLASVTDALNHTTSVGYDLAGNRTSLTDALNRTTSFAFDAQNRLVSQTDPRGGVVHWGYDLAGHVTSLTDADNNTTTWTFDAADRITAKTDPLSRSTVYVYSAADELTGLTDRNGRQRAFDYDLAGRLTAERWLDGSGATIRTMSYTLDGDSQLVAASDPSSAYSFTYNTSGFLMSADNQGTPNVPHVILNYSYEPLGHRTSMADNLGGTVNYGYDPAANLTSLGYSFSIPPGGTVTVATINLAYDNANRLTNVSRLGGNSMGGTTVSSAFTYDAANRLTNILHQAGITTLANYAYTFDAASQLTSYTGPEGTLNYAYDANAELTDVTGARTEHHTYDLAGNRTDPGYVTTTGNRLQSDGTYNYTYDNEGNMLTKTRISDGQNWNFTWDYRNRLTQVVVKNSSGTVLQQQNNTYDIFNRRIGVSTTINGVTTQTWTVYDGANPYADFDGNGNLVARYLYGIGDVSQLFAHIDPNNGTTWYLPDVHSSVRQVVSANGTVLDQITYDSFGNILSENSPSSGDRFKFASGQYDSVSGNYQMGARSYAPDSGRFTSEDPISFAGGDANVYRYTQNIPTTFSDPMGLSVTDDIINGIKYTFTDGISDSLNNATNGWSNQLWNGNPGSQIGFGDWRDCIPVYGSYNNFVDAVRNGAVGRAVFEGGMCLADFIGVGEAVHFGFNAVRNPKCGTALGSLLEWTGWTKCFPKDTLVATEYGLRPIQSVRPGVLVWSYDIRAAEWVLRRAEEVWINDYDGELVAITAQGEAVEATINHPVWVMHGEALDERPLPQDAPASEPEARIPGRWVDAGHLRVGDVLLLRSNKCAAISQLTKRRVTEKVYNLQVEELQTYAVGPLSILVHNYPTNIGGYEAAAEAAGEAAGAAKRIKLGRFLEGEEVAEAAEHAKEVGKVTGVVDREGAKGRRAERMKGREKVPGKDLDEYPPAAIKPDDPSKVSVKPVNPTHNRRSGGRLGHELPPDGTPVEIDP